MKSFKEIQAAFNFLDVEQAEKRINRYLKTYPNKDIIPYAEKVKFEEQIKIVQHDLIQKINALNLTSSFLKEKALEIVNNPKFITKHIKGSEAPFDKLMAYLSGNRFYRLENNDFRACDIENESIDIIVTDPPYPRQYLDLYHDLAVFAERVLKPGGSLFAMAGQSYLPEILQLMQAQGLKYNWTLCYLTPGGQSPQLWQRKVNSFWKPVLWYIKGDPKKWLGDVVKSDVNDNDKNFHFWGQSISGMNDLIQRVSDPGDVILDPFLGGGTTGAACLYNLRNFVGIEIEQDSFETAKERLSIIDKAILND
ncbi:MAG: site-specific DNA-methyltransferase [Chitinophagales bacterium]|nr:site-specific DNA-methyltransferase [Chitinophagales bacterium]